MRFVVSVAVVVLLAACSGGTTDNSVDVVCAEQAEMARAGTTTGGQITITCPN